MIYALAAALLVIAMLARTIHRRDQRIGDLATERNAYRAQWDRDWLVCFHTQTQQALDLANSGQEAA